MAPYIAPRGHRYLQNGRKRNREENKIINNTTTFHVNRPPMTLRSSALDAMSGMPPRSVPDGQTHLQNQGSPMPYSPLNRAGSIITRTARTTYFIRLSHSSPGSRRSFFWATAYEANPERTQTDKASHTRFCQQVRQWLQGILSHKMGSPLPSPLSHSGGRP